MRCLLDVLPCFATKGWPHTQEYTLSTNKSAYISITVTNPPTLYEMPRLEETNYNGINCIMVMARLAVWEAQLCKRWRTAGFNFSMGKCLVLRNATNTGPRKFCGRWDVGFYTLAT